MLKIQIKMFTLAILCIFLLYLWLPTKDIIKVFADNEGNGSTIAGINVDGLELNEIETVLNEAINKWLQEDIKVTGGGNELIVDSSKLQFDIPATINEYQTLLDKPWYAFWESERAVHIPLKVNENEEIRSEIASIADWVTDETYSQLMSQVSFLMDHKIEANLKDLALYDKERLAFSIREIPSNASKTDELVNLLDGMLIHPGQEFSFIQAVTNRLAIADSVSINFVASLLYDAMLHTEFEILERHQGEKIHSSIELGKEVSINIILNEDLKFLNDTDYVGKINASIDGNTLKIEITSNKKGKEVSVRVDQEILSPRIIYRYSNELPIGHEQLIQAGSKGYRVIVYRTISDTSSTEEQRVSRDYYPPVNEIILKSSKLAPVEEGIDSANINDPNMEIDFDGDGLPDIKVPVNEESPPDYDKSGEEVTP